MATYLKPVENLETQGAADSRSFFDGTIYGATEEIRNNEALLPGRSLDFSRRAVVTDEGLRLTSISAGVTKGTTDMWGWTLAFRHGAQAALLLCDIPTNRTQPPAWQYVKADSQGILRRQAYIGDPTNQLAEYIEEAIKSSDFEEQAGILHSVIDIAKEHSQNTPPRAFAPDVVRYKAIGFIGIGQKATRFVAHGAYSDYQKHQEKVLSVDELPAVVQEALASDEPFYTKIQIPDGIKKLVAAQTKVEGSPQPDNDHHNADSVRRDALRPAGAHVAA